MPRYPWMSFVSSCARSKPVSRATSIRRPAYSTVVTQMFVPKASASSSCRSVAVTTPEPVVTGMIPSQSWHILYASHGASASEHVNGICAMSPGRAPCIHIPRAPWIAWTSHAIGSKSETCGSPVVPPEVCSFIGTRPSSSRPTGWCEPNGGRSAIASRRSSES